MPKQNFFDLNDDADWAAFDAEGEKLMEAANERQNAAIAKMNADHEAKKAHEPSKKRRWRLFSRRPRQ